MPNKIELQPFYNDAIDKFYEPVSFIKKTISDTISKSSNNNLSEDDIVTTIFNCCDDIYDKNTDDVAKELFEKTMTHFNKNTTLQTQEIFQIQSSDKANLPEPSNSIIYTITTDILPVCGDFLNGKSSHDELFTTFAFFTKISTLGFYFKSEKEFEDFKKELKKKTKTILNSLSQTTIDLLTQFDDLTLNQLTESLLLRSEREDNTEPYSFARILVQALMSHTNQTDGTGIMPFSLNELYCPKTIIFINIEKHANASTTTIKKEWTLINKSLKNKQTILSNKKLQKLTTLQKTIDAQQEKIERIKRKQNSTSNELRAKINPTSFKTKDRANKNLYKQILNQINKMPNTKISQNEQKTRKMSYLRANRRDPDDFNKTGTITKTQYKPDIHLYIDTSGSINERQYKIMTKNLMFVAKKLNTNIYINSFSHVLSQCNLLRTKNKSISQLYAIFTKLPKVDGGTDYEQIWNYINASNKRKAEFSLIITDFEWDPPNHYVKHPNHLYYVPCSNINYKQMILEACNFCNNMTHINKNIRNHLLF